MSEYASKIALGTVVAVIVGSLIVAGFYYLPQSISPSSTTGTQISTVVGGTTQTGSVITGIVNHTQTETGNLTTVTVTEEIIQESIYTQRACTEQLGVTNTTTFITLSTNASQTNSNNTVTITEIQFSNSTSTTTVSPPSFVTTIINGTTVTEACG